MTFKFVAADTTQKDWVLLEIQKDQASVDKVTIVYILES